MATHTSATTRGQAPDVTQTSHSTRTTRTATINNALKRRAQAVLNDETIDTQTRAIIRYGLEINDPWLAKLVRRAGAGEKLADAFDFSQSLEAAEHGPNEQKRDAFESRVEVRESKIEELAEIICGAGDESAGALFVLMGAIENSTHPEVLAHTVKHLAFTRCGELNLFGMVDAQLAVLEDELLADGPPIS